MDSREYLFIVGVGRSGTTLLQGMIASHEKISILPETHFFLRYIGNSKNKTKLKFYSRPSIIKELKNDKYINRLDYSIREIVKRIEDSKVEPSDIYKGMLRKYKEKSGADLVGVKDPRIIDRLEVLKKHFPQSTVIQIIRDPRDVVLSRRKTEWSSKRSILTQALTYRCQMSNGRAKGRELFGDRYIEVKYEDLITDPENVLKKLCSKINVGYSSSMLQYTEQSQRLTSSDEVKWKKNAQRPIMKDNKNKWINELNSIELKIIESVCYDIIEKNEEIPNCRSKPEGLSFRIINNIGYLSEKNYNWMKYLYYAY